MAPAEDLVRRAPQEGSRQAGTRVRGHGDEVAPGLLGFGEDPMARLRHHHDRMVDPQALLPEPVDYAALDETARQEFLTRAFETTPPALRRAS